MTKEWSIWWRDYEGITHVIYEYDSFEATKEAVERLHSRDPDTDDVYEIRQMVDDEWVIRFVAKWVFMIMIPSEESR